MIKIVIMFIKTTYEDSVKVKMSQNGIFVCISRFNKNFCFKEEKRLCQQKARGMLRDLRFFGYSLCE